MTQFPRLDLQLPEWLYEITTPGKVYSTTDQKMSLAIDLARANISRGGGPFGAAIFELDSGKLVAPGINMVIGSNCSVFHAEIVAIMLSQQVFGVYSLSDTKVPDCELFSTVEPCAMCLGALPWSGIKRLVCGARDEDARVLGFDEGEKPLDWKKALNDRNIDVLQDIMRHKAGDVLIEYARNGGKIYNGQIPE